MFMINRDLLSDETLARVDQLALIAKEAGLSMAQLALAWCLRLSEVSSVITGATKSSQIDQNVQASALKLPRDLLEQIDVALK